MMSKTLININLFLLFFLVGVAMCNSAGAQTTAEVRSQLENQRNRLEQEINQSNQDLKQVQSSKNKTLTQLKVIQNKLNLRNQLIRNLNREINFIKNDIEKTNGEIVAFQKRLDTLRAQYAKMVQYAYKNKNNYALLNFILSAKSFNDAIKRFQYLRQYRDYRNHEAKNILKVQNQLKKKVDTLNNMRDKQTKALASAQNQRASVLSEKQQKDSIAINLQGHEKELMKDIEAKRRESNQVNQRIAAVIRQQIEEARVKAAEEARKRAIEEAKKRAVAEGEERKEDELYTGEDSEDQANTDVAEAPQTAGDLLEATPEAKLLSASFAANKGRLPWPVSRAIVVGTFGVHPHPVLSKVMVDNDGVTLQTSGDAVVKSVFKGTVVAVTPLSGRWFVVIQHGQYFTAYSNLKTATVARGDVVGTSQPIGIVYTNPTTGESELDFKVYSNNQAVDPQIWLAGR